LSRFSDDSLDPSLPIALSTDQSSASAESLTGGSISTGDLAELMSAFTDVTSKLEKTHEQLRSEVSRLNTELYQANEALQRSRRLAALGEMAAGISHEIRNPLGSIKLYANMLIDDLAALPEQKQIVEKIGRAVHGLDDIVGDVLTFAREMKVHAQPCSVSELIDASIEMCCAQVQSTVVCAYQDADPFEIVCDTTLIQQALINVLRNAGEANRVNDGGRISIHVAETLIAQGDQSSDGVCIRICDQGDGVPDEVIERMFNPFFTTRATGTGLGLAIVHRIIDAHRGRVEVINNTDGRGATISLYIPAAQTVVVTREASFKPLGGSEKHISDRQHVAAHSMG
jgi:signal transduction histidine kinase